MTTATVTSQPKYENLRLPEATRPQQVETTSSVVGVTSFFAQWGLIAATWLIVGGALGWRIYSEYNIIDSSERVSLATQAKVIEQNLAQQLDSSNRVLDSIRKDLPFIERQKVSKTMVTRRLKAMTEAAPGVRTILILNAEGEVLYSNREELLGQNFKGREYFKRARERNEPAILHVSQPFKTVLGVFAINLVKTISDERGNFSGIVSLTIDPEYCNTLLDSVRYTPDMRTSIIHGDGQLFLAIPEGSLPESEVHSRLEARTDRTSKPTVITGVSKITGEEYMMAHQTIKQLGIGMDKTLEVVVERNLRSIFGDWKQGVYLLVALYFLLILLSSLALFFYQKRHCAFVLRAAQLDAERRRAEDEVIVMAFHDTLTGLPNRRLLNDRLSQAIAASKRNECYGALMFLDLDNFKPLNDSHGHDVGDLLLIEAANRLKRCVREVDTVSRFGGDEFVVLIKELTPDRAESCELAEAIADKIRNALADPYLLSAKQDAEKEAIVEHHSTASIGVALFIHHEGSQSDILKWADAAMYRAKAAGRNVVKIAHGASHPLNLGAVASRGFLKLAWRTEYNCANTLINEQHRTLFSDANKLLGAILSERPDNEVAALLDELIRDVVQHFKDEEEIFTSAGFPGALEHAAIHRHMVNDLTAQQERFNAGTHEIGPLFQFLAHDVICKHMLGDDREFFPYLKARR